MTLRNHVRQFHEAAGVPVLETPQVPSDERVRLRARLVAEEFFEMLEAMFPQSPMLDVGRRIVDSAIASAPVRVDLVALADGIGDSMVVLEGTNLELGIDGEAVLAEISASNMSKFDGGVRLRADGKVLKSESWRPPRIAEVLRRQGWDG